jgi:hypothetical protein
MFMLLECSEDRRFGILVLIPPVPKKENTKAAISRRTPKRGPNRLA